MPVNNFYLQQDSVRAMAKQGTSFHFASWVFRSAQRRRVADLYSVCRYIDDCADELPPVVARPALADLRKLMENAEDDSIWSRRTAELEKCGVHREYWAELFKGAFFDIENQTIFNDHELVIYCYRVAGIVGLMMCPLLGVKSLDARPYAIDLGVAMQLTNICRDILEDARKRRNYLPVEEVEKLGLNKVLLMRQGRAPAKLKRLIKKYLDLADNYYESAYRGLAYIPLRPRLCVLLAGELYRGIGRKIRKKKFEVLRGRIYLTAWEKFLIVGKTLPYIFNRRFWRQEEHQAELHHYLLGLPGLAGDENVVS